MRYVSVINFVSGETVSEREARWERKGGRKRVSERMRDRQRKWNEFCYHEEVCNKRKSIVIIKKERY